MCSALVAFVEGGGGHTTRLADNHMNAWILFSVAAFDSLILCGLWLYLRTKSPLDRRVLLPVAMGLAGFVLHAVVFFHGAILTLQLVAIAASFGLCWFSTVKRQSDESTK